MFDLGQGEGSFRGLKSIYTHREKDFLRKIERGKSLCVWEMGFQQTGIPFPFCPSSPPSHPQRYTHTRVYTPTPLVPPGAEETPGPRPAAHPYNQHLSSHLCPCLREGSAPHPHAPTEIRLRCWSSCVWRATCLNCRRDDKPGGGRRLFPLQRSDKAKGLVDRPGGADGAC